MAEEKDQKVATFAVGRDGDKIDGIYRGRDPRRTFTQTEDAQLELASRPERVAKPLPPPPVIEKRRSSTGIAIAVVLAVLGLASPFIVRAAMRYMEERDLRMSKPKGLLVIDSTPSDARVFIDGREVGRTPYVAPNTFQPGTEVPVVIKYPGAQDWTGTVAGGTQASISAELQAKQ
jgi:hypothetical protein